MAWWWDGGRVLLIWWSLWLFLDTNNDQLLLTRAHAQLNCECADGVFQLK